MAEVALLAGAAFAVGMRRQSRALGLLAAAGARAAAGASRVLGQGLVLGLLGGLAGVLAGSLCGVAAVLVATRRFDRFLLAPDVRPLELAALTLVGVVTGLLAAALPARAAARQDVVAALRGRRGVVRTRRRYPVVGLVTAAVGAAMALSGGALALALQRSGDPEGLASSALVPLLVLAGRCSRSSASSSPPPRSSVPPPGWAASCRSRHGSPCVTRPGTAGAPLPRSRPCSGPSPGRWR